MEWCFYYETLDYFVFIINGYGIYVIMLQRLQ